MSELDRLGLKSISVRLISGRRVWDTVQLLIAPRKDLTVAIAYISSRGAALLALRRGASVITDASLKSIRAGSTDPGVLLSWTRSGVPVHSLPKLHAKFIVAEGEVPFVVIGSANASAASADLLEEAVVVSDLADLVAASRQQIIDWKRRAGPALTEEWLVSVVDQFDTGRDTDNDGSLADDSDDDDGDRDSTDWPRPTSIYLVGTLDDDSASAEALAKLREFSVEFADAKDFEDVLPRQMAVWMFWTDLPAGWDPADDWTYPQGTHVVTILIPLSGRLIKNAPVLEPGRILYSFVDPHHRPRRTYYYTLVKVSERKDVTFGEVRQAFATMGQKPELNVRYMMATKVDAILGLWPDITYSSK